MNSTYSKNLIDETFDFCLKPLLDVANIMGISYEKINVWLFCDIWPILTLIMFAEILRLRLKINTKNEKGIIKSC